MMRLTFPSFIILAILPRATAADATARQIIDQIKAHVGVPWHDETVDTFKAGNPDTPVTGIATTMMATFDVIRRAQAEGKNLVITHEPTFYSHQDKTDVFEKEHDPVWAEKLKFIEDHKMVVWRFHDHWHMRKPDGIMEGVLQQLGWESYFHADGRIVKLPSAMTVEALAAYVQQKLGAKVLRVVGDRNMKVTNIALQPGAGGPAGHRRALQRDDVEVLLIGEVPEWETIEYVNDASAEGKRKALLLVGHIPSEQPGMDNCARWLKTFIKDVPIGFVPTIEPFWTPSSVVRSAQ
ncbi:MAG TPA: Nif3-like dinuclear metal center hexameric protein [Bryobacteraceae bacterium]